MWRSLASNLLTFLVVGLFLMAGVVLWGQSQYNAEGPLDAAICLQVKRGSNMSVVSRELADRGAIGNPTIFRLGADYTDKATQLKAGSFLVRPGSSMAEIVDVVTRGGASTCGTEIVFRHFGKSFPEFLWIDHFFWGVRFRVEASGKAASDQAHGEAVVCANRDAEHVGEGRRCLSATDRARPRSAALRSRSEPLESALAAWPTSPAARTERWSG